LYRTRKRKAEAEAKESVGDLSDVLETPESIVSEEDILDSELQYIPKFCAIKWLLDIANLFST